MKFAASKKFQLKKIFSNTLYNKSIKEKNITPHIQRSPFMAISRFLSRNLTSLEKNRMIHSSAEKKKKCQSRILFQVKLSFRNNGDRLSQINKSWELITKDIKRNDGRDFSNWNKRMLINTGKGKYIVKFWILLL